MSETFPSNWREQPCYVVSIPLPLIPYVGGLLKLLEQRGLWTTNEDYINGYTATVELEECLMATCLDTLIEQQNALYRMVNTALFGATYETVGTDPLEVIPVIGPYVSLEVLNQESVLGRLDRLTQLVDNTFNGTETPLYDYSPSIKGQLDAILTAISSDDVDIDAIRVAAEAIALLVA
jgi:hypothetical protein